MRTRPSRLWRRQQNIWKCNLHIICQPLLWRFRVGRTLKLYNKYITEDPLCTKFLDNKKRLTTSSVNAEKDNKNQLIFKIITGFQNSIRNESLFAGGVTRFPTNGSREKVSTANRGSNSSKINDTEEHSVVIVGTLSNGYNITCPLTRIGVSLRHVDKVPRGKALEHTRLSYSSTAREFSHGKLINT